MTDLWAVLFIWVSVTAGSEWLFERLRIRFASRLEAATFSSALGLGLLGYLVFTAGLLGYLHKAFFIILISAVFLLTVRKFLERTVGGLKNLRGQADFSFYPYLLPAVVAVFFSLCGALAPAIGQDELCYHLMQPKNYLREHAIYEVPYSISTLWPFLMEMLFTLGVLLKGAELAKLFHFAMYVTTSAAVYCFLKRFSAPWTARFGFLIYLLTPAAYIQASYAYVDNGLACYAFLSFYSFTVFTRNGQIRWAVLTGIFAGLAVSSKLIGVFMLPILLAAFALQAVIQRNGRKWLASTAAFGAAVFVFGSAWYIRAAVLRGNPVFPFYPEFFGGHGWSDAAYVDSHGGGQGLLHFLLLLWNLTMHPQWFGGEHVGPLYLALTPLAILARPMDTPTRIAFCFALGYAAVWFIIDPNIRFFFAGLAFLAVAVAPAAAYMVQGTDRRIKAASHILFITLFAVQALFAVYHFKDEALLLLQGGKERYLRTHERSYAAAKLINGRLKSGDKIFSVNEPRGYYFDNPFVLQQEMDHFTHYESKLSSASELRDFLKQRGFTHVLYSDWKTPLPEGERESWVTLLFRDGDGAPHFKEDLVITNAWTRYVLYKIT